MGWASGSEIAEKVWKVVSKVIPEKDKKRIARKLITIFENADCDTMYECKDLIRCANLKREED